jgi:hypothetical protein
MLPLTSNDCIAVWVCWTRPYSNLYLGCLKMWNDPLFKPSVTLLTPIYFASSPYDILSIKHDWWITQSSWCFHSTTFVAVDKSCTSLVLMIVHGAYGFCPKHFFFHHVLQFNHPVPCDVLCSASQLTNSDTKYKGWRRVASSRCVPQMCFCFWTNSGPNQSKWLFRSVSCSQPDSIRLHPEI